VGAAPEILELQFYRGKGRQKLGSTGRVTKAKGCAHIGVKKRKRVCRQNYQKKKKEKSNFRKCAAKKKKLSRGRAKKEHTQTETSREGGRFENQLEVPHKKPPQKK